MGAMGAILYASAVIIPEFAQQNLSYTATWAGLVLSPGGVALIVLIPIVGRLMTVMRRLCYVIAMGFTVMGLALLYSSTITPGIDFETLVKMRTAQTAGLAFLFVPISTVAYLTLPRRLNGDGAALFSMFRNVFGSIWNLAFDRAGDASCPSTVSEKQKKILLSKNKKLLELTDECRQSRGKTSNLYQGY